MYIILIKLSYDYWCTFICTLKGGGIGLSGNILYTRHGSKLTKNISVKKKKTKIKYLLCLLGTSSCGLHVLL